MKLRSLAVLAASLLISAAAFAHEAKGPNGGRMVDAGPNHVEMVIKDRSVVVFVTDSADKPVTTAGYKGVAILTVSGKPQRIALEPQDGARLAGTAAVPLPLNARGVVQVTGPDGKTAQGRFQ